MNTSIAKTLSLAAMLLTSPAMSQQRENPQHESEPPMRCEEYDLRIPQIVSLLDWVERNHVIPVDDLYRMRHVIRPNGEDIKRVRPRYPAFGFYSEESNTLTIWDPLQEGLPSTVPSHVDWLGNCK